MEDTLTLSDSYFSVVILTEALLAKLRPQFQLLAKTELSLSERKTNITCPKSVTLLSETNNPDGTYNYTMSIEFPTHNTYWDFGSIWCDSSYEGICDSFMKLPTEGCSGPGCGAKSWQSLDGQCEFFSNYKYDPAVRESRTFVWPKSLYGRYYSSCHKDVRNKFEKNCQ